MQNQPQPGYYVFKSVGLNQSLDSSIFEPIAGPYPTREQAQEEQLQRVISDPITSYIVARSDQAAPALRSLKDI